MMLQANSPRRQRASGGRAGKQPRQCVQKGGRWAELAHHSVENSATRVAVGITLGQ